MHHVFSIRIFLWTCYEQSPLISRGISLARLTMRVEAADQLVEARGDGLTAQLVQRITFVQATNVVV